MIFIHCLLIVLLILAVYWKTFKFGLIYDDERWRKKITVEDKGFKGYPFFRGMLKRLYGGGTFLYEKDGKLDYSIFYDHLFTTILHIVVCLGIYFTFGTNNVSFIASILYAVNPANHQTSLWLNGRRYAINIILMLAMISLGYWGLALYPLTVLFQVNAFFTPLVYGWVGILFMAIGGLLCRKEVMEKIKQRHTYMSEECDHRKLVFPGHFMVVFKLYGAYFMQMIFPKRAMFSYMDFHYWGLMFSARSKFHSWKNKQFVVGVIALLLTIAGLLYFKGQMFWFFVVMVLSVLQWSAIIPVTQVFTDRYISLANVFMMVFVSHILSIVPYGTYLSTVLFMFYLINLFITFRMYEDINECNDYHLFYDRGNVKVSEFKATRQLFINRDPMGAWETIKECLKYYPNDMKINLMAAQCMEILGDKAMVIFYLRKAKDNIYIGQHHHYKSIRDGIFQLDLDIEVEKINNKTSKLDKKIRENILKIHTVLSN